MVLKASLKKNTSTVFNHRNWVKVMCIVSFPTAIWMEVTKFNFGLIQPEPLVLLVGWLLSLNKTRLLKTSFTNRWLTGFHWVVSD